jgi:hypothetical protein
MKRQELRKGFLGEFLQTGLDGSRMNGRCLLGNWRCILRRFPEA